MKRRDSDRLGANERRIEIEAKGKEEFLHSPPARDVRGPRSQNPQGKGKGTNRTEGISEQKFISLRN